MKEIRRAKLVSLLGGPRFNGDRAAFCRAAEITKGRLTQLLDPREPFGDVAVRNLSEKLELSPGWFDEGVAREPRPAAESAPPATSIADALAMVADYLTKIDIYNKPTALNLITLLGTDPSMHPVVAAGLEKLKPKTQEPEITEEASKKPHYPEQREPGKKDRRNRAHEVKVDYTQGDTYANTDQRIQKQTDPGSPRRDN